MQGTGQDKGRHGSGCHMQVLERTDERRMQILERRMRRWQRDNQQLGPSQALPQPVLEWFDTAAAIRS